MCNELSSGLLYFHRDMERQIEKRMITSEAEKGEESWLLATSLSKDGNS